MSAASGSTVTTTAEGGGEATADQQRVINEFHERRAALQRLEQQVTAVAQARDEHARVLAQLEPLPNERRCFRHVGGVLVERTVGEAKPQIKQRFEQLEKQLAEMIAKRDAFSKELSKFMVDNNLKVKSQEQLAQMQAQMQKGGQAPPAAE